MNCPFCDIEVLEGLCSCGWRPEGARPTGPEVRSTYQPLPHGITRAEFGEDLYETVKLIGGVLQLRENLRLPKGRATGLQRKFWREQEARLVKQLPGLMTKLPDDQVGDVVARYPWVARC